MDLKELLPVLLITVFAIISAAKKKKQPVSESEEQADTAPSDSPWDDLMRELKKGGGADTESAADSRPVQRTVPDADALPTEMLSYDDEAIEAFENRTVFSYDDMVGDNAPEPMSTADQGTSPTPQLATEPEPASSERAFPGGFDPKWPCCIPKFSNRVFKFFQHVFRCGFRRTDPGRLFGLLQSRRKLRCGIASRETVGIRFLRYSALGERADENP